MLGAIGLTVIPTVLVFMQPDIGTSLVYGAVLAAMLFVGNALATRGGARDDDRGRSRARRLAAAVARRRRARAVPARPSDRVRRPRSDPQGASYNVQQSILAVGAGGLRGRGVDNSTQTNLDYLPEHATDFAFASLAEQRGFVGAAILLLLYLLVVWRGLRVVTYASRPVLGDRRVGHCLRAPLPGLRERGHDDGIAPVTGIPLPFVSVGGSSLVTNLLGIGVLQAIHARGRRR